MPDPLLSVRALKAFYGDFQALYGVDVVVGRGQIVAVIGANGAGKSTLLKTLVGLLSSPARRSVSTAPTLAASRRIRSSSAALRWCQRGGGCSPRSASRKIC